MAVEAIVQLPPDGIGKKIRAIELDVGAHTVYMEGSVPFDEDGVGLYDAAPVVGAGRQALLDTVGLAGEHTNPEKYLHDNHWNTPAEIPIILAGAPGELALGAAVAAGKVRRIKEVTVRHTGTANTVVTILDENGGNILVSIDVPAQTNRVWSSQDGRAVAATLQPVVQSSNIDGGDTFVSAGGIEA
ncbi:hypothetical protein ES703_116411 [subsurface metagenome]